MRKIMIAAVLIAVSQLAMACAMAKSPVTGVWYTNVKAPEAVGAGPAVKSGESCATSILGLIAVGDASIDAARKAGGIVDVAYVDSQSFSLLGLFATYCVQVRGR
jgi:hypothetical protein